MSGYAKSSFGTLHVFLLAWQYSSCHPMEVCVTMKKKHFAYWHMENKPLHERTLHEISFIFNFTESYLVPNYFRIIIFTKVKFDLLKGEDHLHWCQIQKYVKNIRTRSLMKFSMMVHIQNPGPERVLFIFRIGSCNAVLVFVWQGPCICGPPTKEHTSRSERHSFFNVSR